MLYYFFQSHWTNFEFPSALDERSYYSASSSDFTFSPFLIFCPSAGFISYFPDDWWSVHLLKHWPFCFQKLFHIHMHIHTYTYMCIEISSDSFNYQKYQVLFLFAIKFKENCHFSRYPNFLTECICCLIYIYLNRHFLKFEELARNPYSWNYFIWHSTWRSV